MRRGVREKMDEMERGCTHMALQSVAAKYFPREKKRHAGACRFFSRGKKYIERKQMAL